MTQISKTELKALMAANADFFLLDVREPHEHATYHIGGILIPMSELMSRMSEIPRDKLIVIYCRSGHRSQIALEFLQQSGYTRVKNLIGGVLAWQQAI